MSHFSKNVQNILFSLAVLIILYGAYKALFTINEGVLGVKRFTAKKECNEIKSKKKRRLFSVSKLPGKTGAKKWACMEKCKKGQELTNVDGKVKCRTTKGESGPLKRCEIKTSGSISNTLCERPFPLKIPSEYKGTVPGFSSAQDFCNKTSGSFENIIVGDDDVPVEADIGKFYRDDIGTFIDELGKANECCAHKDLNDCNGT